MLRLAFASGERPPAGGAGREVNAWRDRDGEVFARLIVDGPRRRIVWPGLGIFEFEHGAQTVTVWPEPGTSPEVSRDVFARAILPAALQALGWQALHASGVAIDGSALLLVGRSESGKSTVAYALARAGFPQIADDSIVFSTADARLTVVPLPFAPRLRQPSRQHFLEPATTRSPDFDLRTSNFQTGPRVALGCIVELQQLTARRPPSATQLRPAEAFSVVLSHAHCFDPADRDGNQRLTQDYLRLAHEVPVWRLTYAPGLDALGDVEAAVLRIAATSAVDEARQGSR